MIELTRIFHSVGQGGFYSERHLNLKENRKFNIVYDCGNWKNAKFVNDLIKENFRPKEEIDILFISHFDFDHISKINFLKDYCIIKKVVLPLLHENEKLLISNFFSVLGLDENPMPENDILDLQLLVTSPRSFFANNTQIISVRSIGKEIIEEQIEINDIQEDMEISSGTILKNNNWIFIPYNIEYQNRKDELIQLFKDEKLEIEAVRQLD